MNADEWGSANCIGDAVVDPAAKLWPISRRCEAGTHLPHVASLSLQRNSAARCRPLSSRNRLFGGAAGDAGAVRTTTQFLHRQRVEALPHLLLEIEPERSDDARTGRALPGVPFRISRGFEPLQRPHNFPRDYPPPCAAKTKPA